MKNLIQISLFVLFIFSCSIKEEVKPDYAINYPAGINSGEKRMIEVIENKPSRNFGDYIQLSIIYAKYKKPSQEISYWLNQAWEENPEKTQAVLVYLSEKAEDWDLVSEYSKAIEEVIQKEK